MIGDNLISDILGGINYGIDTAWCNLFNKENDTYKFQITPLKETKMILGYLCQKAHVKIDDDFQTEFDVFYTSELKINEPNLPKSIYDSAKIPSTITVTSLTS